MTTTTAAPGIRIRRTRKQVQQRATTKSVGVATARLAAAAATLAMNVLPAGQQ